MVGNDQAWLKLRAGQSLETTIKYNEGWEEERSGTHETDERCANPCRIKEWGQTGRAYPLRMNITGRLEYVINCRSHNASYHVEAEHVAE